MPERNRYSAPVSFANRPVNLRVYSGRMGVVAEEQAICEHNGCSPIPGIARAEPSMTGSIAWRSSNQA